MLEKKLNFYILKVLSQYHIIGYFKKVNIYIYMYLYVFEKFDYILSKNYVNYIYYSN